MILTLLEKQVFTCILFFLQMTLLQGNQPYCFEQWDPSKPSLAEKIIGSKRYKTIYRNMEDIEVETLVSYFCHFIWREVTHVKGLFFDLDGPLKIHSELTNFERHNIWPFWNIWTDFVNMNGWKNYCCVYVYGWMIYLGCIVKIFGGEYHGYGMVLV